MKLKLLAYTILSSIWSTIKPNSIGVRVMLIRNEHILLVKHSYQDVWYFPGGGVKRGEKLEDTAKREIAEEVDGVCGHLELFGTYTNVSDQKNNYVIVFKATDFTFNETFKSFEISEVNLFELENLPSKISRGTHNRIMEYLNGSHATIGHW